MTELESSPSPCPCVHCPNMVIPSQTVCRICLDIGCEPSDPKKVQVERIERAFDLGGQAALEGSIVVLAKHSWRNRRALRTLRGILARFNERYGPLEDSDVPV